MRNPRWRVVLSRTCCPGIFGSKDLIDHLFNDSEKRLARTLVLLARLGTVGRGHQVVFNMSQGTLSEMIGTMRSRVNFFMQKFKRLGFIHYSGDLKAGIRIHASLPTVVLPA